jgi:two-component system, OmpR family, sensor kinase
MNRLGLRRRLLLVVIAAFAVALAALVVGFNLLLGRSLSHSADNLVRGRATAELALIRPAGKRLVVADAPDGAAPDRAIWIFSASGQTLEAPSAGARVGKTAQRLTNGPARFATVSSTHTRLYAAPIVSAGKRLGTVVAAVSLTPYDQTRRTALIGSLILGSVLLVIVALAARWLVVSALRPVARMTRQAAAWGEHDLERRFGLGEPHDELTELAATLDGLLDRLAASLRREQRFSAELSHELRTPLSRVIAETELALRRERSPGEYRSALEVAHASAQQLARTVDALLAAARHEMGGTHGTADAASAATGAIEACAALAEERHVEVTLEAPPQPVRVGVEGELVERILQPVVENACRYGRQSAQIRIARNGDRVTFAVEDDGPGVALDEQSRIFEPGVRGRLAGGNGAGGAGLGLALARRLARSASGDVEAVPGDAGRFLVTLPTG